jgi:hypothetical protein
MITAEFRMVESEEQKENLLARSVSIVVCAKRLVCEKAG